MDEKKKNLLNSKRLNLIKEIKISPSFYAELRKNQILNEETQDDMKHSGTEMRQIGYLLDLLPRRGPNAYEGFINALQSTDQTHVIEIFEPDPKPLWGDEQAKAIAGKIIDGELKLINDDYLMKKSKYSTLNYASQGTYPVNKNYKNRVVIININFDNENKSRRDGSKKDFENLKELFGLMKYDVIGKNELSTKEMVEFFVEERSYLNTSNESHNVWMMIIMSHGTIGGCYDADGKLHAFSDIVNNFEGVNCPGLKGVPKIFIFQCCLGNKKFYPCGTLFNKCDSASADYESSSTTAIPPINDRHDKADVIKLFSTVEEYVSIRNPELGCIYISAFIYVLSNMCRHENLQTMILRINAILSHCKTNVGGQIGQSSCTLDKNIYLH